MPQGTTMNFPCLARMGSKFFKTKHTIQMKVARCVYGNFKEIAIDFEYSKFACFRRSTPLGHVVDVTENATCICFILCWQPIYPYRIKFIADTGFFFFHRVSLLKNRVVCSRNSSKSLISFILKTDPFVSFYAIRGERKTFDN